MKVGDIVVCMDEAFAELIALGQHLCVVGMTFDVMGNYYLELEGYPEILIPESAVQVVSSPEVLPSKTEIIQQLNCWRSEWIRADNEGNAELAQKCMRFLDFFLDKLSLQNRFNDDVT